MYFILTQYPGDLFRRLQGNRGKYIGMCDQRIWITTQIHIVLAETYTNIIYIKIVHGRTFTVELSRFGSDFVALIISTEIVEALRYKLSTFGVNLESPAEVYCDNKSVVTNSSVPASVLNKRDNDI